MTEQTWTVETLARHLWEQAEKEDCTGCRVKAACESNHDRDCFDIHYTLTALGLKEGGWLPEKPRGKE